MNSGSSNEHDRARTTRRALTCLFILMGLAVLAWWSVVHSRSRMSLEEAIELADAGKLTEAAANLQVQLKSHPDHAAAHLLLAQILLKQSDPRNDPTASGSLDAARLALEHLSRVHPENSRMAATFHLTRGNALDRLSRLDDAESDWLEAIEIDPLTPEAGWNLLNLYYLEWREVEARQLALRLFEVEPDPHDRVMLLLELLRHDARPPAPGSLVKLFEPMARAHPDSLHAPLTLGIALTRASQVEPGIEQIRKVIETHPHRVEPWDGLLTCLDETGQVDVMEDELERLPPQVAASPRMLKHRARVAQGRRWKEATELYRQAQAAEPYNRAVEYRLSRALRHVGQTAEADRIEARLVRRDHAIQELRPLYDQATESNNLRVSSHVDLFQKIAETRERMQLPEEARAWHRLVLQAQPDNAVSRTSVARLENRSDQG